MTHDMYDPCIELTSVQAFLLSALLSVSLSSDPLQWSQLPRTSMMVLRTTSVKGTRRHPISQMSIIFVSDVEGSSSILLVKMVVITSMMVRLTASESPNKLLSKNMLVKVMSNKRMVGRKVVKSSIEIFRFNFIFISTCRPTFDKLRSMIVNIVKSMSSGPISKNLLAVFSLSIIST